MRFEFNRILWIRVRRAKDALSSNGSPELKFYPDNEMDDYTNVIMEINQEFFDYMGFNSSGDTETTHETTQEIIIKKDTRDMILDLMKENPKITARELALNLDITFDGVRYHIKVLRRQGRLSRKGSTKTGEWIVIK